ncbi:MAG: energy-coupling factor ABC transporter permease, partial [Candidatus Margulisiibacteriota bacterium]
MHLPDGFLDKNLSTGLGLAAAGVLSYAFNKMHQLVTELGLAPAFAGAGDKVSAIAGKAQRILGGTGKEYLSKLAMVASLVFAAQMFNFPVSAGTSGHLLGGVLAAMLLGPWGGAVALTIVLTIQALFYADGGII